MSDGVPRIVLDTNVWLDLLLFHDPGCAALEAALHQATVCAVSCDDCRDEWRRVLHYPQLPVSDAARASLEDAFDRLAHCLPRAMLPSDAAATLPQCADPDDQKFLELAQASGARWLLSKDKALLVLDSRVRKRCGFAIMLPTAWPASDDVG